MIEYAEDQVGKPYDDLQLISSGLHLIAWIVYPPWWGKELKVIKALNRKGGREHCISGVTADLRWAEALFPLSTSLSLAKLNRKYIVRLISKYSGKFFKGYSAATTFPCLVPLSKNWEVT